jgi:hypothetical protein
LESLQTLISIRFAGFAEHQQSYNKVVQSGLLRILDSANSARQEAAKMDDVTVLLAIKVYLLFAPTDTVTASIVKYPILNTFSNVLQHAEVLVQRQCIKILHQIYRVDRSEVSAPFIQATAPIIIRFLLNPDVKKVDSLDKLGLHSDALETLEILIVKSHPDKQMLDIYIPILVNLLLEDPGSESTCTQKQHDMALARLTRIGNQLPQDLKRILSENPELKRRLEQAVLKSQEQERLRRLAKQQQQQVVSKPSIKLKTDFSNFT